MDKGDIVAMFDGISDYTKSIIAHKLNYELAKAIRAVNHKLASARVNTLCPKPALIMNAFRQCPIETTRVVILGQDPYIGPGEAQGMSFSVPNGVKIPYSLKAIFENMIHHKLLDGMPNSGDLTYWARQGVLLINTSLTTILGKSNDHASIWSEYTDKLIAEISAQPQQLIFVLLGKFAQKKCNLIDARHKILTWGHPSPLNAKNRTDNPENFKYCPAFVEINKILDVPIYWSKPKIGYDIEKVHPRTNDTLWVFTDGGARANGGINCKSSWAYYINDGHNMVSDCGIVPVRYIPDQVYKSSNNRGELTAIYWALIYIKEQTNVNYTKINIVTDSKYSIGCLTIWAKKWLLDADKLKTKKNLDIIIPAMNILNVLNSKFNVKFLHIRSHKDEPQSRESEEWFMWKCNDIVDKLCTIALE